MTWGGTSFLLLVLKALSNISFLWYRYTVRFGKPQNYISYTIIKLKQSNNNPKFFLFQGNNGLWGCRDATGKVVVAPSYELRENGDGKAVYLSPDGSEVCEFSDENGFELMAWCEPWWYEAESYASYSDEIHSLIAPLLKKNNLNPELMRLAALDAKSLQLDEEQIAILDDIDFYYRWMQLDDGEDDRAEKEWFTGHTTDLTAQQRVDLMQPLIGNMHLSYHTRQAIAWGIYRFNYLFNG